MTQHVEPALVQYKETILSIACDKHKLELSAVISLKNHSLFKKIKGTISGFYYMIFWKRHRKKELNFGAHDITK